MTSTTLTVKGQVTVPIDIRNALHIKNGDKVAFVLDGDKAVMLPLKGDIFSLRGTFKKFVQGKRFDPKTVRSLTKRHMAEQYVTHRHGK